MNSARKIKWLIAHQPQYLFVRTAEAFQRELDKVIPGEISIEILTMRDYVEKYGDIEEMKMRPPEIKDLEDIEVKSPFVRSENFDDSRKKWDAIFKAIADGKIEFSQTQVTTVAGRLNKDFSALDLPFLFHDHDHATRVLDGDIGQELLDDLSQKTEIKGLGFTYSGGYRVIGSKYPITSLSELIDSKIVATTVPTVGFFKNLGANSKIRFKLAPHEATDLADNGGCIETTYLRFSGKNVLKTNHSMFLTSILTGNKFWNSLTTKQQEAFTIAAKKVSKIERAWSIEDAEKYENRAKANGINIYEMTEEETARMKEVSKINYTSVDLDFKPNLVKRILDLA